MRRYSHYIHTHKTEALITASLQAGAYLAMIHLSYSMLLQGMVSFRTCFQITDDILDITGDIAQWVKTPERMKS